MPPTAATDLSAVSAGLDLVSGVFGYLTAQNANSIAQSRADLIRMEAEANAQRYAEQAQAHVAQQKVMFLASGVTLKGSPIDVLDTSMRVANENIAAIKMQGQIAAMDESQRGLNAELQGRNALLGGAETGLNSFSKNAMLQKMLGAPGFSGSVGNSAGADDAGSSVAGIA